LINYCFFFEIESGGRRGHSNK